MKSEKFIVTKDAEVAKKLASIFQQIDNTNGMWVFINTPTSFNFAEYGKKIAFTNILCI